MNGIPAPAVLFDTAEVCSTHPGALPRWHFPVWLGCLVGKCQQSWFAPAALGLAVAAGLW